MSFVNVVTAPNLSRIKGSIKALIALPLVLGVILGGCSFGKKAEAPKTGPIDVGYVVLKATDLPITTTVSGRTSAFLSAEVRPQIGGIIQQRLFEEGAIVKQGQALYQIDPRPAQATLSAAEAGLAVAQANLTSLEQKAHRAKALIAIKAISQQDFEDAQTAYDLAKANLLSAKSALDMARINLGYTKVYAPISGHVGMSSITPGALVSVGQAQALTTLQDTSKIYVDVTQSASELLRLRSVQSSINKIAIELVMEDGRLYPLKGHLSFADVSINPSSGTASLRAVFDNPEGKLLPGLFVRAHLIEAISKDAIIVPQKAVSRTPQGEASVYIVGSDGTAQLKMIKLDGMYGDQWHVISGLSVGDKVITEGLMRLRPNAPIKPSEVIAPPSVSAGA